MKKILNLSVNDFRHVFRDRMLLIFLFTPIFLICFVRFFVPFITDVYPAVGEYHSYIMMFAGVQTSIMFGFITAFMMLEEKDEDVMQVIRVLPISAEFFIMYRLLFATVFSTMSAFFMIQFGNLEYPGLGNSILLSLQYGLAAPFITLVVATYAKNKVEGLAFFKALDLLILIPITGFLFFEEMKCVFSFIPMFWTYELYANALNGANTLIDFFIGVGAYLLVLTYLVLEFRKKVFNG